MAKFAPLSLISCVLHTLLIFMTHDQQVSAQLSGTIQSSFFDYILSKMNSGGSAQPTQPPVTQPPQPPVTAAPSPPPTPAPVAITTASTANMVEPGMYPETANGPSLLDFGYPGGFPASFFANTPAPPPPGGAAWSQTTAPPSPTQSSPSALPSLLDYLRAASSGSGGLPGFNSLPATAAPISSTFFPAIDTLSPFLTATTPLPTPVQSTPPPATPAPVSTTPPTSTGPTQSLQFYMDLLKSVFPTNTQPPSRGTQQTSRPSGPLVPKLGGLLEGTAFTTPPPPPPSTTAAPLTFFPFNFTDFSSFFTSTPPPSAALVPDNASNTISPFVPMSWNQPALSQQGPLVSTSTPATFGPTTTPTPVPTTHPMSSMLMVPAFRNMIKEQATQFGDTAYYEQHGCIDPSAGGGGGGASTMTTTLVNSCSHPTSKMVCMKAGRKAGIRNSMMAEMMARFNPTFTQTLEKCLSPKIFTKMIMQGMGGGGAGGGEGGMNPMMMMALSGGGGGAGAMGAMPMIMMMMNQQNQGSSSGGSVPWGTQQGSNPASAMNPTFGNLFSGTQQSANPMSSLFSGTLQSANPTSSMMPGAQQSANPTSSMMPGTQQSTNPTSSLFSGPKQTYSDPAANSANLLISQAASIPGSKPSNSILGSQGLGGSTGLPFGAATPASGTQTLGGSMGSFFGGPASGTQGAGGSSILPFGAAASQPSNQGIGGSSSLPFGAASPQKPAQTGGQGAVDCSSVMPLIMSKVMATGEGLTSPEAMEAIGQMRMEYLGFSCQELTVKYTGMPFRMCCPGKVEPPSPFDLMKARSAASA